MALVEGMRACEGTDVCIAVSDLSSSFPFLAKVRGETYPLGLRFLEQILYAYEPIADVADAAATFAAKAYHLAAEGGGYESAEWAMRGASAGPTVRYMTRQSMEPTTSPSVE